MSVINRVIRYTYRNYMFLIQLTKQYKCVQNR